MRVGLFAMVSAGFGATDLVSAQAIAEAIPEIVAVCVVTSSLLVVGFVLTAQVGNRSIVQTIKLFAERHVHHSALAGTLTVDGTS